MSIVKLQVSNQKLSKDLEIICKEHAILIVQHNTIAAWKICYEMLAYKARTIQNLHQNIAFKRLSRNYRQQIISSFQDIFGLRADPARPSINN